MIASASLGVPKETSSILAQHESATTLVQSLSVLQAAKPDIFFYLIIIINLETIS